MLESYLPLVLAIGAGMAVALGMLGLTIGLNRWLGPRKPSGVKMAPFDCGSTPIGSPRVRFSVKFYEVAILFLVFDIESAFLYPWAVVGREMGWFGVLAAGVFVATLVVALVYVWSQGRLDWGPESESAG
jgi:NADH-quinone oxidoreductase subunit A